MKRLTDLQLSIISLVISTTCLIISIVAIVL